MLLLAIRLARSTAVPTLEPASHRLFENPIVRILIALRTPLVTPKTASEKFLSLGNCGTRCVPSRLRTRNLPCLFCGCLFRKPSTTNPKFSNKSGYELAFDNAPYKVDVGGSSPSSPTFFINKNKGFLRRLQELIQLGTHDCTRFLRRSHV